MTTAIDLDTCPHCEGVGAYWDDQTGQPDEPNGGRMITCETCKGERVVDTSPCIVCGAPSYDHDEGCMGRRCAMNGQCEYEHDGFDTDGTEWFRCTTHDELAPSDSAPCAGYEEIPYTDPKEVRS